MKTVINSALQTCANPRNKWDDQYLFWQAFKNARSTTYREDEFHHCLLSEYTEPSKFDVDASRDAILNLCCLDPFYYPVGEGAHSPNPITYHANWVNGKDAKIEKLISNRADGYGWTDSRVSPTTN